MKKLLKLTIKILLLAVFLIPQGAYAAITFDTSGAARTAGTATVSLAAAEANEIAILFVWGSNTAPTSVTVDGVAATSIGSITFASATQGIFAYYFLNPSTSSINYSASQTGSPELHVLLYKGAKQTGQPDSFASSDQANPNPFTISTNVVADNSWLVSMARDYTEGATTASTGTTQRNAGVGAQSGDSNAAKAAGSQSMSWAPNTANNDTAGFIVSIAPTVTASAQPAQDIIFFD